MRGAKTGGRRAGTPNKRTAELAERLIDLGCDPLAGLANIAADPTTDVALRARVYADLLPYLYPRRRAVELTGQDGGSVKVAADVVQRQVEAYNDHDLDRFVSAYSETIAIFRMPAAQPSISGKRQLAGYCSTQRFNLPGLRAEIMNRIVLGDKVIDHERVWGVRDGPIEVAAIYQVVGDLIERVWFFSPEH
jgi:hypothetical protein